MVHALYATCGNLYCYGGNNPVRYVDPDGEILFSVSALIIWGVNAGLLGYGIYQYTADKGKELYRKIDSNNSVKCTSLDLYCLYRSRQGRTVSLDQVGLLEKIQNAVEYGITTTTDLKSIQNRFIKQLKKGKYQGFNNSYQFEFNEFAIGNASINGIFNGIINKNEDGTVHIEGTITYRFTDEFTDPYDTFDWIHGEWNPDGVPYNIYGMWDAEVNGDF